MASARALSGERISRLHYIQQGSLFHSFYSDRLNLNWIAVFVQDCILKENNVGQDEQNVHCIFPFSLTILVYATVLADDHQLPDVQGRGEQGMLRGGLAL